MLRKLRFSFRFIRRFSVIPDSASASLCCVNQNVCDAPLSNRSGSSERRIGCSCDTSDFGEKGQIRDKIRVSGDDVDIRTRCRLEDSSFIKVKNETAYDVETRRNFDVSSSIGSGEGHIRDEIRLSCDDVDIRMRCRLEDSLFIKAKNERASDVETRRNFDVSSSICSGEGYIRDEIRLSRDNVGFRGERRFEEPALIRLKNERDPDKLFQLFKENASNRLVVENKYAFEDTVSRLAGASRCEYIEDLLEEQKSLPQGRREGFMVRIIMLYGRAGMVKQAVDTFYNMHLFRCKRSVKSLNAALKVLTQAKDLEAINLFLRKASSEFGVELDVISMNIVVSAFCQMGILDKAYMVMVEMEKQGTLPDVVTFTTLISAFYKHGRWVIGNGLWNLMMYKGCRPNVATFNARIQFLVYRGRAWDANDMLCFMEKLGMPPDEVTYNLVIKGFFMAGFNDMAKRVYSALHGRGCKPNVKIYQTMVHFLCKAGDFDSAYNMCKECLNKNWVLNVDTIYTLLKGLNSKGKIHNAWIIVDLAERRRPPFHAQQLDAFKYILGSR